MEKVLHNSTVSDYSKPNSQLPAFFSFTMI